MLQLLNLYNFVRIHKEGVRAEMNNLFSTIKKTGFATRLIISYAAIAVFFLGVIIFASLSLRRKARHFTDTGEWPGFQAYTRLMRRYNMIVTAAATASLILSAIASFSFIKLIGKKEEPKDFSQLMESMSDNLSKISETNDGVFLYMTIPPETEPEEEPEPCYEHLNDPAIIATISQDFLDNHEAHSQFTRHIEDGDLIQAHRIAHDLKDFAARLQEKDFKKIAVHTVKSLKNGAIPSPEDLYSFKAGFNAFVEKCKTNIKLSEGETHV